MKVVSIGCKEFVSLNKGSYSVVGVCYDCGKNIPMKPLSWEPLYEHVYRSMCMFAECVFNTGVKAVLSISLWLEHSYAY